MAKKIEISYRTIVFTVFFLVLMWFLYFIRDVIFQVFIALLIMSILNPTVTRLQKLRVPRVASVLIVYILVLGFLSFSLAVVVPPLIEQTTSFANSLPRFVDELDLPAFVSQGITQELSLLVGRLPSQVLRLSVSIFSNVLAIFAVLVFALYFLLARDKLDRQLATLFSDDKVEKKIERIISTLEFRLGGWARGQIVLMIIVGLATYIGLVIIGVPFAVPLALLAGILEIIPNIGPTLAVIPSVIVGFSVTPLTGVAAAALGILIQQVENYALVPKVMQKSAGLSPIITLLSLVIGLKVAGVMGALLSVPVVITSQVLLEELVFNK
jgi:predicted PurR-regulated permease PerM